MHILPYLAFEIIWLIIFSCHVCYLWKINLICKYLPFTLFSLFLLFFLISVSSFLSATLSLTSLSLFTLLSLLSRFSAEHQRRREPETAQGAKIGLRLRGRLKLWLLVEWREIQKRDRRDICRFFFFYFTQFRPV